MEKEITKDFLEAAEQLKDNINEIVQYELILRIYERDVFKDLTIREVCNTRIEETLACMTYKFPTFAEILKKEVVWIYDSFGCYFELIRPLQGKYTDYFNVRPGDTVKKWATIIKKSGGNRGVKPETPLIKKLVEELKEQLNIEDLPCCKENVTVRQAYKHNVFAIRKYFQDKKAYEDEENRLIEDAYTDTGSIFVKIDTTRKYPHEEDFVEYYDFSKILAPEIAR